MHNKPILGALILLGLSVACAKVDPTTVTNHDPSPPTVCMNDADCQTTECNHQQCVQGACVDHWRDADGDGYADMTCGNGPTFSDCNDGNPGISPGALETCDCVDNDCDGTKDNLCNYQTKILYPGMDLIPGKGGVFGCYADLPFLKIDHPSNENCKNATTPALNTVFMNEADEGNMATIWYYGCDGKKYLFSFLGAFESWFGKGADKCCVTRVVSKDVFESIPRGLIAGGKVCYHPGGNRILKTTMPDGKVWDGLLVVSKGCVLHYLASEQVAEDIFGPDWRTMIEIIPFAHYFNYFGGSLIESKADYDPVKEEADVQTIDQNQNL